MKSSVNISQATFYAIRPEFFTTSQKKLILCGMKLHTWLYSI